MLQSAAGCPASSVGGVGGGAAALGVFGVLGDRRQGRAAMLGTERVRRALSPNPQPPALLPPLSRDRRPSSDLRLPDRSTLQQ